MVFEQDAWASSFCTLPDIHVSLPKLTFLRLSGYVNDIETHALERMPCLEVLGLEGSMWKTSDPPQWEKHLPTSIRRLAVMPTAMDMGLPRICRYCRIAPYIRALDHLRELYFQGVSGLRLSEWQEPFSAHLTGLSTVTLNQCRLPALPACVAGLSTLTYLDLAGNPLDALPVGPYLSCLRSLWAIGCNFTAFPLEAISRATALTRLGLSGNTFEWTEAANEAVKNIESVERWTVEA
jgi:hypothetical protein